MRSLLLILVAACSSSSAPEKPSTCRSALLHYRGIGCDVTSAIARQPLERATAECESVKSTALRQSLTDCWAAATKGACDCGEAEVTAILSGP